MAKGDDAVRKKRNKTNRKRLRNSESSVSARVAAIIAAKRRRKTGKRRGCEGMCFSLPTPDDPFNDRQGKKTEKNTSERKSPPHPVTETSKKPRSNAAVKVAQPVNNGGGNDGDTDYGCPSKFLILCLNAIQDAWKEQQAAPEGSSDESLLACNWGVEFWKCCSSGSHIIDTSGSCASRDQVVWLVSTASDVITRKEKQGEVVASPFLLFLVPTQEEAVQVRSVCKPLKALGLHTVSLHPGAPLDHQVQGLKSCEPEFLVSTPDRLLELVSLGAIDISGVSLLVLDGVRTFLDLDLVDKINSIRKTISGNPQVVIFGDCTNEAFTSLVQNMLRGPVSRLSLNDAITSQSAFISQHVHFYTVEEEKIAKIKQILAETLDNEVAFSAKVLLISEMSRKYEMLTTSLKNEGYDISKDSNAFSVISGRKVLRVAFTDNKSLHKEDVKEFDIVIFVNLPSSIEDYIYVLTRMARHSITGVLHSFFCKGDAPLAQALVKVLMQCGQTVPEILQRNL
ncbi:DEAD-box ATP-dependent RNA helicase 14 [Canna indica]|uniref:DEAD-box ATP-dependent RNA helicase 14 n=1 Tax=Canna indica TaxID=4628 RepID=A0AAQ3K424_9LILI|nr:DEAD-box ATP-dependent RNA helicase 14 [Canna indica]